MNLRKIMFSSIVALALFVLGIEFILADTIVIHGFESLEQKQTEEQTRRLRNAFGSEVEKLDFFVWDWSSWDDTYAFMQDENQEYIASNLITATFTEQRLNAVLYWKRDGTLLFGRYVHDDGLDDNDLLQQMVQVGADIELPAVAGVDGSVKGIVLLAGEAYFIAKRPVLMSGGDGPPMGCILMARRLSEDLVKTLSKEFELNISRVLLKDGSGVEIFSTLMKELKFKEGVAINFEDDDVINGYALLNDINGLPSVIVQESEARSVFQQGRRVARYNDIFLGLVIIAYSILFYLLLNKKVLTRLERLSRQVKEVGDDDGQFKRIPQDGRDEIAELGQSVNQMLEKIEAGQLALREAHDDLERRVAQRTEELEVANEELVLLDKAKSRFLSSTSHELRTPLTSILGFVKLMERSFDKHFLPQLSSDEATSKRAARFKENIGIVRFEAERLGRLVDDLLDLNKIESGRMEWRDEFFDLGQLIEDGANTISGQLMSKGHVGLIVEVASDLPRPKADKDRIHQVLINLLNNAVKFTEKGHVKVAVREVGDWLEVSVEDTGSGIPDDEVDQIFEVFYQAQAGDSGTYKPFGTGLGLAICKEIVEHYNGTVQVESTFGHGSRFAFTLPIPGAGKA